MSLDSPGSTNLQSRPQLNNEFPNRQSKAHHKLVLWWQSWVSPDVCSVLSSALLWLTPQRAHFLSSLLCAPCCTLGSERAAGKTHDMICPPYFTVCLSSLYFAHREEMGARWWSSCRCLRTEMFSTCKEQVALLANERLMERYQKPYFSPWASF